MAVQEIKPGQRVRVVQKGTLKIGNLILEDNIFEGVVVVGKDEEGNYLVKGIVKTPQTDTVSIPPSWVEPL